MKYICFIVDNLCLSVNVQKKRKEKRKNQKNLYARYFVFIWLSFHHSLHKQLMPIYGLLNVRSSVLVLFNIITEKKHLSLNRLFFCMKYPLYVSISCFLWQNVTTNGGVGGFLFFFKNCTVHLNIFGIFSFLFYIFFWQSCK